MKFLIAGLGSIGRRYFHNLIALGEKKISKSLEMAIKAEMSSNPDKKWQAERNESIARSFQKDRLAIGRNYSQKRISPRSRKLRARC